MSEQTFHFFTKEKKKILGELFGGWVLFGSEFIFLFSFNQFRHVQMLLIIS